MAGGEAMDTDSYGGWGTSSGNTRGETWLDADLALRGRPAGNQTLS
jgi:hypothetical protein